MSYSGRERNRLFMNRGGAQFENISGISGANNIADGRAYAVGDFDRDGWYDIALVNANAPLLSLYRNRLGERAGAHRMIAVRFVGGNHAGQPASFANRDGYGAVVTVSLDALRLRREHRAGDGLASQNSKTMLIGIGARESADTVTVIWPSGRTSAAEGVPAGTLITFYEQADHSPTGAAAVVQRYRADAAP